MLKLLFRIIIVFLFLFSKNISIYADKYIDKEIYLIYKNLSAQGVYTQDDFNFLKSLKESDLINSADSTKYQYHYLYSSWLDANEGDLTQSIYHVSKAIKLVETNKDSLQFGVFNIEYKWLLKALALYYENLGEIDKAIFQYERVLVRGRLFESEELPNKNLRRLKSDCLTSLGHLYALKGYDREVVSCYSDAFEISQIDYEPDVEDVEGYFPLWSLANYYMSSKKDFENAVTKWNELIAFFGHKNGSHTKECAQAYYMLGASYGHLKKFELAIKAYKNSISVYDSLGMEEETLSSYGNLFCIYAETGNIDAFNEIKNILYNYYSKNQIEEYYKCFASATTLLSSESVKQIGKQLKDEFTKFPIHLQTRILINLAEETLSVDPKKSIEYCEYITEIIESSEYKETAIGWQYTIASITAMAYDKLKNTQKAIEYEIKSLNLIPKLSNASEMQMMKAQKMYKLAGLYIDNKNYKESLLISKELLPISEELYGESSMEYANTLTLIGINELYQGYYKDAKKTFENCARIIESISGKNNWNYAMNIHNLGRTYMLKGDKEKAIELLMESRDLQLSTNGNIDSKTNQYLNELGIYE